jgi:DNA-binding PadR family transcriptional regulator
MAVPELLMTRSTQTVLGALVAHPNRDHHGAEIHRETGLAAGVIYPVLARLEALQWLDSGWEPPVGRQQGWPRRRYYRLSTQGLAMARGALASARAASSVPVRRLRPAGEST